jgi:hypothetical protein
MNRATPQMVKFARRLIIHEASGKQSSEAKTQAGFHVFDKLRPHLATLMGKGGYRALQSRARALAGLEVQELRAVQVKDDGNLGGLEELLAQFGPEKLFECRVILLARMLGLLMDFIGRNLTLRLVREIWPKVSLDDLDSECGGKNEKS